METSKKFTKWTDLLYRSFHSFINIVLATTIILQTLIFTLELNDYKVTIPEFLITKIRNLLLEKEIAFEASDITLKLTGEVDLKDLKINYAHFTEPLITCDHLRFDLSVISLLFGKLHPEEILIKNATFFFPASLAPSGLQEPFIKNFFGAVSFGKRHARIEQFDFEYQNVAVIAEGSWSHKNHPTNSFNINVFDYLSLSTTLLKIKDRLSLLDQPVVAIQIRENEKGVVLLDANLTASAFTMDKMKLGPLHVKSQLLYEDQKLTIQNSLEISTRDLKLDWNNDFLLAQSAQAQLTIDPTKATADPLSLLQNLQLSLNNITAHHLKIDSAEISCDLADNVIIPSTISAFHNNNWMSVTGKINLEKKSINGFIKGSSNLSELKTLTAQFTDQDISKLEFDGRINWRGQFKAHQEKEIRLDQSNFVITSKELSYNDVKADRIYIEANLSSNQVHIPFISIEGGENYAKGSIFQNFKTGDYRYLLTGAIVPESLNRCLGNWWKELLTKFQFSAPMPFGNMDVRGNLFDTSKWVVFGEVQANNFIYSGIPLKELSLRVNSNEKELELLDLHVNSMKGTLEAYTRFKYNESPPHKELVSIFVKGSSSLALNELDTIIEVPTVHNILTEFSLESTPNLIVRGEIFNNNKTDTAITVQLSTDKAISYHNIPFDFLSFTGHYTPARTLINNLSGGFAKGTGKASITITPTPSAKPTITADVHLLSINQEMAVSVLEPFWKQPSQKQKKANSYGGLINLDLETTGTLGELSSFTGSGKVSITKANLAKINLLWILSEILSPLMPFGLGSLNLTDATSDFLVSNRIIHFPNINIYGSTASIDGEGNFYLGSQKLDFLMNISPINKNGIPIISQALLVFTPITQSFQMHLGGTLNEPKWETTLTPLGLFKKKGPGLPTKN